MTGKRSDIDIKRNIIETELMTAKSFFKANRKVVLSVGVVVLVAAVIAFSAYVFIDSASRKNLVKYEKFAELYRLNQSDEKAKASAIEGLKKIVAESGFGIAVELSCYELGNIYFDKGKYDESISYLDRFIKQANNDNILKSIAVNKVAVSYEESGKIDEALTFLNKYDSSSSKGIVSDQILYNIGRLYQKKGNKVQAKSAFERLISSFPGSIFTVRAKERVFLIDSK